MVRFPPDRAVSDICRVSREQFNAPALFGKIAFRGVTAINKLLFGQPLRYPGEFDLSRPTSTHAQTPLSQRIDSIQLLRAVAAIAVVTQHVPIPIFGDGLWGVDLFFVISGFIMCHATARSGRNFFLKRIIRIVPLYWLGTLFIYALALTLPQLLNTTTANPVDLLKSLLFIPFIKGGIPVPIVFQGWTLNYEMFFYGLFWISLLVSRRPCRTRRSA